MTKNELLDIGFLAKLEIKEDEIDGILKDMQDILKFADKINEVDVTGISFRGVNKLENVLRKDEIIKSYPQEEILKNTKAQEDGFFYLKNSVGG